VKHLSILLPIGKTNLMKIVGTREIFEVANYVYSDNGKQPVFSIQFVGCDEKHEFVNGFVSIKSEVKFTNLSKTDLIIIPAIDDNYESVIAENKELVEWLQHQYKNGAAVASLCTGAFLLAATGLLAKKQCTTHWWAAPALKKMFPEIKLVTERIITDEKGLYTSGGSISSFNLLLHLIEKYYDRATALSCARALEIDIDRTIQSQFAIFSGQKDHTDEEVKQLQEFIEENISEKLSIESLANKFGLSKRNLERRFKKATGNTPVEYIQRVKVEAAKRTLESSRKTVNDVMYGVGYADVKAFRTIFKKYTGISPIEYKLKYSKE